MIRRMVAAALVLVPASFAQAQDWPTQPMTLVVPFGAGGGTDLVARAVSARMGELLGQQIVIENVGGAGGMNGASRVARATPDGYQLAIGVTGTHAQNQSLYKKPLYNAATDFAAVGLIADGPYILITRNELPVTDFAGFAAYARANQSKMQFGSAGAGSGTHVTCLLLNSAIGIDVTHVPYRSTTLAMPDMIAGRIDYICEPIQTALPLIQSRTVKAIATLNRERSPALANLPSAHEQGLTGFEAPVWYALFLPRGAPDAIVRRLNKALSDALDTSAVRERLEGIGLRVTVPERRSPDYLARLVVNEIEKYAAPIKASGVSMD
jgi:tripartite-type tricarboxylate transporter receptor subunit TctC